MFSKCLSSYLVVFLIDFMDYFQNFWMGAAASSKFIENCGHHIVPSFPPSPSMESQSSSWWN